MENKGYFMTLWLYLWHNIIKHSLFYKFLHGIYEFISKKWATSRIANIFRTPYCSETAVRSSLWGRICFAPFSMIEKIQRKKREKITAAKEKSGTVRIFNYLLHNLLALNLRFIGALIISASATLALGSLLKGNSFTLYAIGIVFGILLCIPNINLTEYLSGSGIIGLFSKALDTDFSFNFFYITKCGGKARIVTAVIFGILAGCSGVVIHPLLSVLFIGGLFIFALILYKTEFGVYITVFLAPLVPTMLIVVLSLLCFMSLIVRALTTKKFTFRTEGTGFMILLMFLIYTIATATSFHPANSIYVLLVYFAFMMFYFVVINTIKNSKQLFDLIKLFVFSGVIVCIYGIIQYLFIGDLETSWVDSEMFSDITMRIYSTLDNPNVLGEFILLVLPLNIAMIIITKKPFSKLVFLFSLGILGTALIMTFSRGCWLGFLASAVIFITFATGKLWGLALIALPLIPFVLPESIINRFTSIGDVSDSSTSYRVSIWLGTMAMLKDYWISGVGLGPEAFNMVYPYYSHNLVFAQHPHNLFLNIISECGIVGIVLFLLLIFIFIKRLITGYQYLGKGNPHSNIILAIGAALIGFLIQGMFDNCFYNYRVFMMFWTMLALGVAACHIAKSRSEAEQNQ